MESEAQWEFAARAGNGDTFYGDGSSILNTVNDANLANLGRYRYNGGYIDGTTRVTGSSTPKESNCTTDYASAWVGSYEPNDWGIYDTCGNVGEWCLDWFAEDISELSGMVNVTAAEKRVYRGGHLEKEAGDCRPAFRYPLSPSGQNATIGFRVACQAGLK